MPPTNGQPQPPVPRPAQPIRQAPTTNRVQLHPEAENLAYGYSDLLVELDQARAKIGNLQRQLEAERRYRIYWQNFVAASHGNGPLQCWMERMLLDPMMGHRPYYRPPDRPGDFYLFALIIAVGIILCLLVGCTVPLRT